MQMRSKRMAQRLWRNSLGEADFGCGAFDGALERISLKIR
jgi:hypothetical protein